MSTWSDELCDKSMTVQTARELAAAVLEKPKHSLLMTKEAVNAYAGLGSRAAREAALKRSKAPTRD